MSRILKAVAVLVFGAALFGHEAAGQDVAPPGFGIDLNAGAITASAEKDVRDWGPRFEGSVRYTWPSGFHVAAGGAYSLLKTDNVQGFTVDTNRDVVSIFADGRLYLNMAAPSVAPYIGARAGYLHHSVNTEVPGTSQQLKVSGNGWEFAGLVGILARISDSIEFESYLSFGLAPLGKADVTVGDTTLQEDGTTSYTASLMVGFVYSFGS